MHRSVAAMPDYSEDVKVGDARSKKREAEKDGMREKFEVLNKA